MALLLVLAAASVWPGAVLAGDAVLPGRVLRVVDGDTLDVRLSSGRIRVRLHGVDAPESDQPGGAEATRWLQQRLRDRDVQIEPVSQDQYDRLVAIVHLEDSNVNRELVQAGQAWAYRRYLRRADRSWCDAEAGARASRVGLWATGSPRAPWEHRATRGRGPFTDFSNSSAEDCRRAIGRAGTSGRGAAARGDTTR